MTNNKKYKKEEVEGTVAFCNLAQHEIYNGKDTEKYTILITFDEKTKDNLASKDIRVKEYNDKYQRKFTTRYPFKFNGETVEKIDKEIMWGSKVKIKFAYGNPSPVWGMATYIDSVDVLEDASQVREEQEDTSDEGF